MSSCFRFILFSTILFFMASCQSDGNNAATTTTTKNEKPTPKDPTNLLEGRWENIATDKEFIIFKGGKMIRRFAGATPQEDKISNEHFNYYEKCHAPCQSQSNEPDVSQFKCFTLKEEGNYNCYKITKLDGEALEFTLMDGTGPRFAYKRLQ